MDEVRREHDQELLGFVVEDDGAWLALTLFHGVLGRTETAEGARDIVRQRGLGALAERWYWFSRLTGEWRVVLPQESSPGRVRVAVGYYSLPGVESATITTSDLAAGDRLTLEPPNIDGVARAI
jgi:hypothetical protein